MTTREWLEEVRKLDEEVGKNLQWERWAMEVSPIPWKEVLAARRAAFAAIDARARAAARARSAAR